MTIEIHNPELEKQLAVAAAQAGRAADDLAQDAIAGYLAELAETAKCWIPATTISRPAG